MVNAHRSAGTWLLLLTLVMVSLGCAQPAAEEAPAEASGPLSGSDLLDRMIAFHDPQGAWPAARVALGLEESRPDGTVRKTSVIIDKPSASTLIETQREGLDVSMSVVGEQAEATVGGAAPTDEQAESLRLTSDQVLRMRNYYVYLYGLPMKLRDPGTLVDPVTTAGEFQGREAVVLRITYEPDVGGDTWLFYADPETYEMFGYRFFHDEQLGDGEYIVLEGLAEVGGMRLPASRTWYMNQDDKLLGTDSIVESSAL